MTEFDAEEVLRLVSEALAKDADAFSNKAKIPLGMAQGDLIERLFAKLSGHLNQADAQVIFDDLRSELYEGLDAPPLRELHAVTLNCRRCKDAVKPEPNLPKWNVADPDCVVVADNPFYDPEHGKFLVDALVKAGFSSSRICLTYVNRCPARRQLELNEIQNCLPYLFTELQILKPKLIVPLGAVATATLLGRDFKLKEVRGTITWLGPWAIMPTYTPAYALRTGESLINNFKSDLVTAYNFCYGVK